MSTFAERPRGWREYPLTISRIQREAIDAVARRGPRPDEIRLIRKIEAEAVRERRLHNAAEIVGPAQSEVTITRFARGNSIQQATA